MCRFEYNDEFCVIITEENQQSIIETLCDTIFNNTNISDALSNTKESDINISDKSDYYRNHEALANILLNLPKPLTIVQEFHHIDRCYRDTYYMYFSNQHFDVERYSKRLSFFYGCFKFNDFFTNDTGIDTILKENYIGSCVINPLIVGAIGRTLINPKYINISNVPVYMRLCDFKLHIYGKSFNVYAFPYRMQDAETTCCAEVTLLNIMEYYSNSFGDYKSVLPSEIINTEQNHSHERVLPAKGMSYPMLTKVLSEFGFSPRLYNLSSINQFSLSKVSKNDEMKRLLHYYVESGIPVAVNLSPIGNSGSGHSIVCIGHGSLKEELLVKARKNKWISWISKDTCHPIINSADFYEDYVIVDDNQPIYQLRNFEMLSAYSDLKVSDISVPLYKRMFLDALDASSIVLSLLHHEQYGISTWMDNYLNPREDVVIRLFMASSHNLKIFRTKTMIDIDIQKVYATLPMPRFVWVCELYRVSDYDSLNAFGEIIIDATSAYNRGARSVILIHYLNNMLIRSPDKKSIEFEMLSIESKDLFPGYNGNLFKVE